jgi:NAD(P)-dependent dehydrogenase (short-subunit alcohol dehydrogenase family)
MRLTGKVAVVVGAGQTPGDTIGNGRAISVLFAREGAEVLCVDRRLDSAEETCALVAAKGGVAHPFQADITVDADNDAIVAAALERWGRIDILVNNVGIGTGDDASYRIAADAFDRIHEVNLKGPWRTCKAVLPVLREQRTGSIVNVSSIAAVCSSPLLAYKTSKAALNAMTQQMAIENAKRGVRVNAVMPGLMDTPMAIEGIAAGFGVDKDELRASRSKVVPLRQQQGTAWDVAYAVLYLASDEANFVTGVLLPVDGGQSARSG